MCGITGILHLDSKPADPSVLKAMADTLAHRGPDDEGFYFNNQPNPFSFELPASGCAAGLAHRRLSILLVNKTSTSSGGPGEVLPFLG